MTAKLTKLESEKIPTQVCLRTKLCSVDHITPGLLPRSPTSIQFSSVITYWTSGCYARPRWYNNQFNTTSTFNELIPLKWKKWENTVQCYPVDVLRKLNNATGIQRRTWAPPDSFLGEAAPKGVHIRTRGPMPHSPHTPHLIPPSSGGGSSIHSVTAAGHL